GDGAGGAAGGVVFAAANGAVVAAGGVAEPSAVGRIEPRYDMRPAVIVRLLEIADDIDHQIGCRSIGLHRDLVGAVGYAGRNDRPIGQHYRAILIVECRGVGYRSTGAI